MRKLLGIIFLFIFLLGKANSQTNLIPNPGFETGNNKANCDYDIHPNIYGVLGISGNIDYWNTSGALGFWAITYSYPNWCTYNSPLYPGNNRYMHLIFGKYGSAKRQDEIWAGLNNSLLPNTDYTLRLQIKNDGIDYAGSIKYPDGLDLLGVIFSKYGQHWYQDRSNSYDAFYIPTSQNNYITVDFNFTSPNRTDLKNIVLIMFSGSVDIDNVELFQNCSSDLTIQNKDYFYPDGPYEAPNYIVAGNNVGAPGPAGDVTVHNGGAVYYTAGGHVELDPGFSVHAGGVFSAQIVQCLLHVFPGSGNDTSISNQFDLNLPCPLDTLHISGIGGDTTAYVSWNWNFGNGQTSTSSHPSVYYTTPGTDTITLYGKDSTGHIDTNIGYVVVPDCNVHRAIHTKNNSGGSNSLNNTLTGSGLTVQPNPTNGNILLSINEQNNDNVKYIYLYNIYGQLIYQTTSSQNAINIDLSNYSAGLYLILVQSGSNSWCKKVVKE